MTDSRRPHPGPLADLADLADELGGFFPPLFAAGHRARILGQLKGKAVRRDPRADRIMVALGAPIEPEPAAWAWWVGDGHHAESYAGPFPTFAAAEQRALQFEPGAAVVICEAHQSFAWNCDLFDADTVLETLADRNEEAFGEDGPDDMPGDQRDLELSLAAALRGWLHRNKARSWAFAAERNQRGFFVTEVDGRRQLEPCELAPY